LFPFALEAVAVEVGASNPTSVFATEEKSEAAVGEEEVAAVEVVQVNILTLHQMYYLQVFGKYK
jgi:hypothetical protein